MTFEDEVRPRGYVEAYPRLEIAAALKAAAKGQPGVVWRDERGEVIGGGIVACPGDRKLVLNYGLYETCRMQALAGRIELDIEYRKAGLYRHEPYAKCPSCNGLSKRPTLHKLTWACSSCQQLKNRSSMVGSVVRWSEQLETLEARIGAGRPKHMQDHTYWALAARRDELTRKLHDRYREASACHSAVVTSEWAVNWYADDLPG